MLVAKYIQLVMVIGGVQENDGEAINKSPTQELYQEWVFLFFQTGSNVVYSREPSRVAFLRRRFFG